MSDLNFRVKEIHDGGKILTVETLDTDKIHMMILTGDGLEDYLDEIVLSKDAAKELADKLYNFYCL